ncbi:putative thiamine biosynthetic bifunctional enzyme [Yarrowia sp. B02]|nr:putative thiamine biosynthetic bifunctional enzyme [Yarrowia sp. B02]
MTFDKKKTDYSIYLVTDSGLVPEGLTLEHQVEQSILGGATLIQLREKTAETGKFLETAKRVHAITKKHGVPLLINDRLDIALAIDCEGVHVGQDDMPVVECRRMLGKDKIIGLSITNREEYEAALAADKTGADIDYFGVGAVYGTFTKKLRAEPLGLSGMRALFAYITEQEAKLAQKHAFVTIGGVKPGNTASVRYMCGNTCNGVAVVSCIIAAEDAKKATEELAKQWHETIPKPSVGLSADSLKAVNSFFGTPVFVHHITNNVVKNVSANITIAIGSSPAMSETRAEFREFAAIPSASLLLNMGTATPDGVETFLAAGQAYNAARRPVVFDPVGGGASEARKSAVKTLLKGIRMSVIKGNDGEIFSAAGLAGKMRGVDSIGESGLEERVEAAAKLSRDANAVVVMTGKKDVVMAPSGKYVLCNNGDEYLTQITGSGCMLGSVITSVVAGHTDSVFDAALAGLLLYTIASEKAGPKSDGPGTFMPRLIDEISVLAKTGVKPEDIQVEFGQL